MRSNPGVFLVLSKVLDLAVAPITWALALLLVAAVLRNRGARGFVAGVLAFAVLYVFSTGTVAGKLSALAERGVASTARPGVVYDAALILGGALDGSATALSGQTEIGEAAERLTAPLELWRQGRVKKLLVVGGDTNPVPGLPSDARRVEALLVAWGVPADRILVEERSRNTRENAIEAARIVADQQLTTLLLVTSAWHMPRALGCFRAVGLSPDVLPVDHRASGVLGYAYLPRADALNASTAALRELTGRVVYWVMRYTR